MITRLIAGNKDIGTSIEEQFLVIQNYGMGSTIAIFLIVFMAFILLLLNQNQRTKEGELNEVVWKIIYWHSISYIICSDIFPYVLFI